MNSCILAEDGVCSGNILCTFIYFIKLTYIKSQSSHRQTDRKSGYARLTMASLTSITGSIPVSGPGAVTDEAIPAFFTDAVVFAGVAVTLFACYFAAGRLDSNSVLCLCDLANVFTASVYEEITDAPHIAIVQHSGPQFSGKNQANTVVWQTSEI